jgi:hypothetical protein
VAATHAAGPSTTSGGRAAQLPVSLLIDGVAGCWPRGSGPDISSDYLYRGVYANQIARLAAHIPPVSCRSGCSVCGVRGVLRFAATRCHRFTCRRWILACSYGV